MAVSIFLPTRKGSQRVQQKNTRSFAGIGGGLLELKLGQLIKLQNVDEIILSTNDKVSVEIAEKFMKDSDKLKIFLRPDELASSETDLSELIKYVPQITNSEHILWTHVTSPFCTESHYAAILHQYFQALENGFDSLVGVLKFMNFLWDPQKQDIINRKGNKKWPQTQDLNSLFEINNTVFLAGREHYLRGNRLGEAPLLHEMSKISSLDIDDMEDFKIAEAVYYGISR